MDFSLRQNGDTIVVDIPDALGVKNRNDLKRLVLEVIHDDVRPLIIIDLQRTRYVDSAALGALVMLRRQAAQRGGEMWVANLNAELKQLFSLTKVDRLLPCLDDLDEGDDDGRAGRTAPRRPRMPGPLSGSAEADLPPADSA